MAEQEVIKHTKKVYKVWNSREHSLWSKIKEFLVEIFIIVFAITVSIWFHNWSEHNHQKKEVKDFLMGLKSDLQQDIKEMTSDSSSYTKQCRAFSYLTGLKLNSEPNLDTLNEYYSYYFNTTSLNPNDGRYEGFKSAGKIGLIENKDIQNHIMDLYQELIPALKLSTNSYIGFKIKFTNYIQENGKRLTDSTTNFRAVIKSDQVYFLSRILVGTGEIISRYSLCMQLMKKIIAEIDKEYE